MTDFSMGSCQKCFYYNVTQSQCKKNAPVPEQGGTNRTNWPVTAKEDWCGEYRSRLPMEQRNSSSLINELRSLDDKKSKIATVLGKRLADK